ncbi:EndoU domain-containing protein [Sciscionella sediminilitoris]|uniref:EndoU domain-containing protein n=1 Tax=Sciscionella sediminilitoris TaxID=1445613 RepID=UPI0004DF895B|nr:EndoU domain-containing protein [Sciscionella sp. SE31]
MFDISEGIRFTLDEHPRLRLSVPVELRPLAAWLHTDAQANHGVLVEFGKGLRAAQLSGTQIIGNGWVIRPAPEGIELLPRYTGMDSFYVPDGVLWPVLEGIQGLLGGIDQQLRAEFPAPAHQVLRSVSREPDGSLRDHTYFPQALSERAVAEAGQQAWQSEETLIDESTGAWSGFWQGMEIAGYYDPASGQVQSYFPVMSPLSGVPAAAG